MGRVAPRRRCGRRDPAVAGWSETTAATSWLAGLVLGIGLGDHGGGILSGLAWIAVSIGLHEPAAGALRVEARALP